MNRVRPLSPHLTIYKPQITSLLSILHRISGSGMLACVVLFVLIVGVDVLFLTSYVGEHIISKIATLLSYAFTVGIGYHFVNGIRHLIWDFGIGLSVKGVSLSGYVVLIISFLLMLFLFGVIGL